MSDLQLDEKLDSLFEKKEYIFEPRPYLFFGTGIEQKMKYEEILDSQSQKQDPLPKEPSY